MFLRLPGPASPGALVCDSLSSLLLEMLLVVECLVLARAEPFSLNS